MKESFWRTQCGFSMEYEFTAERNVLASVMEQRSKLLGDKRPEPIELELAPDAYEILTAQLMKYMRTTGHSGKEVLCGMRMSVNNRLESMHFTLGNSKGE